jgi:hypothetical protein
MHAVNYKTLERKMIQMVVLSSELLFITCFQLKQNILQNELMILSSELTLQVNKYFVRRPLENSLFSLLKKPFSSLLEEEGNLPGSSPPPPSVCNVLNITS